MIRLLFLLLWVAIPCWGQLVPLTLPAGQQSSGSGSNSVVFSVNGGAGHTSNSNSLTFSLSGISAGFHLVGVVHVAWGSSAGSPSISSVTWAGTTMTSAGTAQCSGGTGECVQIFTLTSPGTGSPSVVVSLSATEPQDIWADGVTFTGVNQTTPVRSGTYTSTQNNGSTTNVTLTITSQTGDSTTTVVISQDGNLTTNQTVLNNNSSAGQSTTWGTDYATGAATVTDTWTGSGTSRMEVCGFSLAAG